VGLGGCGRWRVAAEREAAGGERAGGEAAGFEVVEPSRGAVRFTHGTLSGTAHNDLGTRRRATPKDEGAKCVCQVVAAIG